MTNEKRKSKRFTVDQLVIIDQGREESISSDGINLSASGVLCRTDKDLDIGTRVSTTIIIPHSHDMDETSITSDGVVVRNSGEKNNFEIGIEFTSLKNEDREFLRNFAA